MIEKTPSGIKQKAEFDNGILTMNHYLFVKIIFMLNKNWTFSIANEKDIEFFTIIISCSIVMRFSFGHLLY